LPAVNWLVRRRSPGQLLPCVPKSASTVPQQSVRAIVLHWPDDDEND
jgi:hypothetical protein